MGRTCWFDPFFAYISYLFMDYGGELYDPLTTRIIRRYKRYFLLLNYPVTPTLLHKKTAGNRQRFSFIIYWGLLLHQKLQHFD